MSILEDQTAGLADFLRSRSWRRDLPVGVERLSQVAETLFGSTDQYIEYASEDVGTIGTRSPSSTIYFEPSVMPADNDVLEMLAEVISRGVLYSDAAVCVLPLQLGVPPDPVSGRRGYRLAREIEDAEFRTAIQVFELNRQYLDLIERSRVLFVPRSIYYRPDRVLGVGDGAVRILAPLTPEPSNRALAPVNALSKRSPRRQVEVFRTLLLPYFPQLNLADVVKIARDETDAFVKFNVYLTDRLVALGGISEIREFDQIMYEINGEVEKLRQAAKKILRARHFAGIELAFFGLGIGAVFAPPPYASLGTVAGSIALFEILKKVAARGDSWDDLRNSQFYLPFRLSEDDRSR